MKRIVYYFLYLFIFTLPWEDMFVVSGIGAVSKITGFLFFTTSIVYVFYRGYLYKINVYSICIIMFVLWGIVSFFWSNDKSLALVLINTLIQLLLMFLLMSQLVNSKQILMRVLQSFVLGGWVSSIGIINSYFINQDPYSQRFSAGFFDPNELGIILVISIIMSWYLSLQIKNTILTIINRIYIVLGAFSVFLTGSRTAFLALIVSFIYILFLTGFKRWKKTGFSLKIILSAILIFNVVRLVPANSMERLLTTTSNLETGDFNSRQDAWMGGIKLLKDHPFMGVGLGSFRSALESKIGLNMVAHNIYISVSGELGLIGLFLLLLIIILKLRKILLLNKENKYFLLTIWIVWFFASLTLTWEHSKTTWFIFALVNVYYKISKINRSHSINERNDWMV